MAHSSSQARTPAAEHFDYRVVDGTDRLQDSYALRYQVYCEEKGFLPPENYPDGLETDPYDDVSVHVAAFDKEGGMAGTVRLVCWSDMGFPMFDHCDLFPDYEYLRNRTDFSLHFYAELSRLAVATEFRRRVGDGLYGLSARKGRARTETPRRRPGETVIGLYKTMYQASKRRGITHWLAAMEQTLWKALNRFKFTFEPIGPVADYYGRVTPYLAVIADIERKVYRENRALFLEFTKGLEPELVPEFDEEDSPTH